MSFLQGRDSAVITVPAYHGVVQLEPVNPGDKKSAMAIEVLSFVPKPYMWLEAGEDCNNTVVITIINNQ